MLRFGSQTNKTSTVDEDMFTDRNSSNSGSRSNYAGVWGCLFCTHFLRSPLEGQLFFSFLFPCLLSPAMGATPLPLDHAVPQTNSGAANAQMEFYFLRDGALLTEFIHSSPAPNSKPPSAYWTIDTPEAGEVTYKAQTLNIHSSTTFVYRCKLVAFEIM